MFRNFMPARANFQNRNQAIENLINPKKNARKRTTTGKLHTKTSSKLLLWKNSDLKKNYSVEPNIVMKISSRNIL